MEEVCIICNSKAIINNNSRYRNYFIECQRCGNYSITDEALTKFKRSEVEDKVLSLSYWIRHHQLVNNAPSIDLILMRELLVPFNAPKPIEQVNNLITWVGNTQRTLSDGVAIKLTSLISIIGCYSKRDVLLIMKHLAKEGLLSSSETSSEEQRFRLVLSFNGWEKYYELKTTSKDSRLAFMAMQFDNKTLQKIFNDVIKVAVSNTGYEIRKIDEVKVPGLIDDKLRIEIRRSKFMIADLSDENRGAYWEAGYAEGLGIQVIYICEEGKFEKKSTHFDTNHHLTVLWKDDSESLKKFAEELKATIRATFPSEAKMED